MSQPDINIGFKLDVAHQPGATRTDGFSLLTYAPAQWGEGVRTENNGTPVEALVAAVAETDRARAAARFGVTAEHVKQALAWSLLNAE